MEECKKAEQKVECYEHGYPFSECLHICEECVFYGICNQQCKNCWFIKDGDYGNF